MGLLLLIAGCIAVGTLVAYAVVITIRWLKNKLTEMRMKRNVKKVAAVELEKMIEDCPNQMSLQELNAKGYDMVLASVNDTGKIEDVEVVKNEGNDDYEVDRLLGDERMVVIT